MPSSTSASTEPLRPLAACIGIDWASDHHDIALHEHLQEHLGQGSGDPHAPEVEVSRLPHTPEAIAAWLRDLEERFHGQSVGIAIETSRGPLVSALLDAPFIVLYPVNPRSLARFREAIYPSGAKDDVPDARLLLELLLKHRSRLAPWQQDDVATRTIARLTQHRRSGVDQRTRLVLQLQALLKGYFPQAITWAGDDLSTTMACDFLKRWPTLDDIQRTRRYRPSAIRHFYTHHSSRSQNRIAGRLEEIATAQPLTRDRAVIESSLPLVRILVAQLDALRPALEQLEDEIARRFAEHPDAEIFESLPGAGAAMAPRLLAAFGSSRARFASAEDIQRAAGIAPITVRSGKQQHVKWRWAASTFLRQTFHEFAGHSVRNSVWAKAFYRQQRQRGKTHNAAIRSLAYKWIRILWRCWQDHTTYDDARYTAALRRRGSPLAKALILVSPPTPSQPHKTRSRT